MSIISSFYFQGLTRKVTGSKNHKFAEGSFSWDRIAFKRRNCWGLVGGYTPEREIEFNNGDLTFSEIRDTKLVAGALAEFLPFTGEGLRSRRLIASLLVFKSRRDAAFVIFVEFWSGLLCLKFVTEFFSNSWSFSSFSFSSRGIFLLALYTILMHFSTWLIAADTSSSH